MKLLNRYDNIENILYDYYKVKKNKTGQNTPSLQIGNIIKRHTVPRKRLIINTAFTSGLAVISIIFIITAGEQSELAILLEKVMKNTKIIEHIRSGSNNMFEVLSKNFM